MDETVGVKAGLYYSVFTETDTGTASLMWNALSKLYVHLQASLMWNALSKPLGELYVHIQAVRPRHTVPL